MRFYRDGKLMDRLVGYPRIDQVRAEFQKWIPGACFDGGRQEFPPRGRARTRRPSRPPLAHPPSPPEPGDQADEEGAGCPGAASSGQR